MGSQIIYNYENLFFGSTDETFDYILAGSFWADLILPSPYYEYYNYINFAFGELYLRATPTVIRFLDAENPNREVIGAAADGESQVIIEVRGAQEEPEVIIPENGGEWVEDDYWEQIDYEVWHRNWQAPENITIDRPSNSTFQFIDFEYIIDDQIIDGPDFSIFKVPVVLVHGIWSGPEAWNDMKNELDNSGFAFSYPIYYKNSSASLEENRNVPAKYIEEYIELLQLFGYTVNKVDLVCHSMGGILAKSNYSVENVQENVRRIVTIGTPHYGTPWVDNVLLPIINEFPQHIKRVEKWFEKLFNHDVCITCGAVEDLQVQENPPIVEGNALGVPSLTANGISIEGNIPNWIITFWEFLFRILKIPDITTFYQFHQWLFGKGVSSDWIVSGDSQKAGMSNILDIDLLCWWIGHLLETTNDEFINATINFLESDSQDILEIKYQPLFVKSTNTLKKNIRESNINREEIELTITQPEEGEEYYPGDSVHVVAEGESLKYVLIIGSEEASKLDSIPPFDFDFEIPQYALGEFNIIAFARDIDGNIGGDLVKVNILSNETIQSIVCWPQGPFACSIRDTVYLDVYGTFSDNVERNITYSSLGTSYYSSNTGVAEIIGDGIIKANSSGEVIITIENQVETNLHLYVLGSPSIVNNPDPPNGMTGVPISTNLDWWGAEYANSYDLYLWKASESQPSTPTVNHLTKSFYDPPSDLESAITYFWQVVAKNYSGETEGPKWMFVTAGKTSDESQIKLSPNPFVPSRGHTQISFFGAGLPFSKIKIFNKAGELVKSLKEKEGMNRLDWNATGDNGKRLASGVYIWVSTNQEGKKEKGKFSIIR